MVARERLVVMTGDDEQRRLGHRALLSGVLGGNVRHAPPTTHSAQVRLHDDPTAPSGPER